MKKGFTLMELLVVIAIIAVVSVASAISFSSVDDATSQKELENKYIEIQRAASLYLDLHSDRLEDFVTENKTYIPLSVLDQEGYITSDLSDPTGGPDISKNYSVEVVNGDNYVETCIVNVKKEGVECIANQNGKKENCCTGHIVEIADVDLSDVPFTANGEVFTVSDSSTGITKFDKGSVVNSKIKSLVLHKEVEYTEKDTNVKAFKYSKTPKSNFDSNDESIITISSSDSKKPIFAWYDKGTIYFYSEDNTLYLNADSSHLFERFLTLSDISGLSYVNASNVETLEKGFRGCYSLESLDAMKNWNVRNLKSLSYTFGMEDGDITEFKKVGSLKTLEPLANWNVSNLVNLNWTFKDQVKLKNLKGLENWNTANVKSMYGTFSIYPAAYDIGLPGNLSDLNALKKWNVSNVEDMSALFYRQQKIKTLKGLENWNTSKVKSLAFIFESNFSLSDISALSNWNTSSVTNMTQVFQNDNSLTDISALANWDVSNVNKFKNMFCFSTYYMVNHKEPGGIKSLAPLRNWNMKSAENISYMFDDQIRLTNLSAISGWEFPNIKEAKSVFGMSSSTKSNGYACSDEVKNAISILNWSSNVTGLSNFKTGLNRCP